MDYKMPYYQGKGMEVSDVIEAFELGFNLGNVTKYVLRCGKKGNKEDSIKDLCKAIKYLEKEIARIQKSNVGFMVSGPQVNEDFKCCYCDVLLHLGVYEQQIDMRETTFNFMAESYKCPLCGNIFSDGVQMDRIRRMAAERYVKGHKNGRKMDTESD